MPYSTAGKNVMLDNLGAAFVSAHSANPGDNGANELSGGSYARQAISFGAASAGSIDSSVQPVIPIPAGGNVSFIGYWTLVTGGTFLGYSTVTTEAFASAGNYTVTDADLDLNS